MFNKIATLITRKPKTILVVTAILIVASATIGFKVIGVLKSGGFNAPKAQSTVAQQLLDKDFKGQSNFVVLVEAKQGTVNSPEVKQAGLEAAHKLATDSNADNITSYWQTNAESLRSTNGRYALITAHLPGTDQAAIPAVYQSS